MSRPANVATGKCRDRQMSRPANVATGKCRDRQMSRPAEFQSANVAIGKCRDRQMSRPANVATGKCRDRQKSDRQKSDRRGVSRQMSHNRHLLLRLLNIRFEIQVFECKKLSRLKFDNLYLLMETQTGHLRLNNDQKRSANVSVGKSMTGRWSDKNRHVLL